MRKRTQVDVELRADVVRFAQCWLRLKCGVRAVADVEVVLGTSMDVLKLLPDRADDAARVARLLASTVENGVVPASLSDCVANARRLADFIGVPDAPPKPPARMELRP